MFSLGSLKLAPSHPRSQRRLRTHVLTSPVPSHLPRSKYEDCAKPDPAAGADLERLQEAAAAWGAVAAAEQRAGELRDKAAAQKGLEGMSLEGEAEGGPPGLGREGWARSGLGMRGLGVGGLGGKGWGGLGCAPCFNSLMVADRGRLLAGTPGAPHRLLASFPFARPAGKKRSREEAFLSEQLDAFESFVGSGKGSARICRCVPG